ncbi:MAG: TM0996/MTH895 family glutaredoxin-like protein [Phycisphaerae bacterium]|nr:TM0996/MTH895 family glutaredoxin-like protein [Phycisphaerae bacterium]
MKKIQILGTGCPKCKMLAELVGKAVDELGLECEVEKIEDINDIVGFGVMMLPGLVVDGEVKLSGKVPNLNDLKAMIS